MDQALTAGTPALDRAATDRLVAWLSDELQTHRPAFETARVVAARLGARRAGDVCEVIFWAPELLERRVPEGDVFVEVLDPEEELVLARSRQSMAFRRTRVPIVRIENYCVAAISGMRPGSRERVGSFYSLVWRDAENTWSRVLDPLAASLPFGVFAPAEYYDVDAMLAARTDGAYWAALPEGDPVKLGPAANILQIHAPTATASMTLAGLTRHIETLAERVRHDVPLAPADRVFLGYEAIQLLPVEPTTVYEAGPAFWAEEEGPDGDTDERVVVDLRRPDTTNWGYDIVISGMAAVNPALLETGRPDELVDLACALHNFPGRPKKLILDVVFGHADNQGLDVLSHHWFAGPNMYGQNVNYRNPMVRAMLLEMQRRKVDYGADAVRVDGAQDFKWWDADAQVLRHDDEYLQEMADIVQEVAGRRYRPWFIFEDGRPWPEEDWELSSTYRAVIEHQRDDDVFQWGPLTFAHNTPFLYTFWLTKFWRIREILEHGQNWISGCANHDTLRRGTQINPKLNINTRLGDTRMEILDKAYDHPAAQMLTYAAFPGVPMDFLNAMARASWGFIRNQDDRWGVKIVAEEAISLGWQVDDYTYSMPGSFTRLKELGFADRDGLGRFFKILEALVDVTDYDLEVMAKLLNEVDPPLEGPSPFTARVLKQIARAWMDDMHDYCNVTKYLDKLGEAHTEYMLALREFRLARPWLRGGLRPQDHFDYQAPTRGSVAFRSLRHGPDGEQVFAIAHLEGKPLLDIVPTELPIPGLAGGGWEVALASPPIGTDYAGGPIDLHDGMAVLYTRRR
ncbi:glucosylglycerol hydrolase [Salinarimonas rosea]|uniref:glucosylglycerol hydrolase n=1 Tax=Salinarimonas rosea TaxID=552063 RepID=UPI000423664F|nr:glucosylglycerol hydrolase [Salinarimonas rosea]